MALSTEPAFEIAQAGDHLRLVARGTWTTDHADQLEQLVASTTQRADGTRMADVDVAGIERMDTFGAWLIERTVRRFREAGATAGLTAVPDRFAGMFDRIHTVNLESPPEPPRRWGVLGWLDNIGR